MLPRILSSLFPALRPEERLRWRIPLGWRPSLHPLRPLWFVRGLLRYYATIRLPACVHHRLVSLDFPMRPKIPISIALGAVRLSRFPYEVFPSMPGVSDPAEPASGSR
jgi:hypothetical protein